MRAAADDDDVVGVLQLGALAPHPALAEEVTHRCDLLAARRQSRRGRPGGRRAAPPASATSSHMYAAVGGAEQQQEAVGVLAQQVAGRARDRTRTEAARAAGPLAPGVDRAEAGERLARPAGRRSRSPPREAVRSRSDAGRLERLGTRVGRSPSSSARRGVERAPARPSRASLEPRCRAIGGCSRGAVAPCSSSLGQVRAVGEADRSRQARGLGRGVAEGGRDLPAVAHARAGARSRERRRRAGCGRCVGARHRGQEIECSSSAAPLPRGRRTASSGDDGGDPPARRRRSRSRRRRAASAGRHHRHPDRPPELRRAARAGHLAGRRRRRRRATDRALGRHARRSGSVKPTSWRGGSLVRRAAPAPSGR